MKNVNFHILILDAFCITSSMSRCLTNWKSISVDDGEGESVETKVTNG